MKNLLLALILFVAGSAAAQGSDPANPTPRTDLPMLKVGDSLPGFRIAHIYNQQPGSVNTDEYRDRLVIFDFGNTGCSGCVQALSQMDSLQRQFGDKIKIFWVTYEKENIVDRLWKRSTYTRNNAIPTIVEDNILRAYFKHGSWPHEAWVYKGKVVAITGPDYVDAKNIRSVLNGEKTNWPVKDDFYVFDPVRTPLFLSDSSQAGQSSLLCYSALGGYRDKVNSVGFTGGRGIVRDSLTQTVRTFFLNQPVWTSYFSNMLSSMSYAEWGKLVKPSREYWVNPNEIEWDVADKKVYKYFDKEVSGYDQDFVRKYGICYESLSPDTGQTDQQIFMAVNKDLDRMLGLQVGWEKRTEKVLVLVRTNNNDGLLAKKAMRVTDPEETNLHYKHNGSHYEYLDCPLWNFIDMLNQQPSNPYVFDGTSLKQNVDLSLNIPSWTDIPAIRKELSPYGLDLKEEVRQVDKLIFKEVIKNARAIWKNKTIGKKEL